MFLRVSQASDVRSTLVSFIAYSKDKLFGKFSELQNLFLLQLFRFFNSNFIVSCLLTCFRVWDACKENRDSRALSLLFYILPNG